MGAFLCGVVVAGLAYRLLPFSLALPVLPASFTAAWFSTAAVRDVTGLWMIGAVLVAFGTAVGAAALLGTAAALKSVADGLLKT